MKRYLVQRGKYFDDCTIVEAKSRADAARKAWTPYKNEESVLVSRLLSPHCFELVTRRERRRDLDQRVEIDHLELRAIDGAS